jgi:hypothetical protein
MPPLLLCRPPVVPRQMRGGVLRHYGGTAFHTHDDAVPPRMAEISGENVCPGGRGYGYIHHSIDLSGRMNPGRYCLVDYRMFLWSRYGPSSYRTSTPAGIYIYASSGPDPFDPLPLTAPRLRSSVSGAPRMRPYRYRRPTFGGCRVELPTPGAPSVGSPRVRTPRPT